MSAFPSLEPRSGAQLRTFQRLVVRMMTGEVGDTAPTFVDAAYLKSDVKIAARDWKRLVKTEKVFVWLDYVSAPQGNSDNMAMLSIPAYVERCSHFFALCPPVPLKASDQMAEQFSRRVSGQ